MRRSLVVWCLSLLFPSLCAAVTPGASGPQPAAPAVAHRAALADRDGDRISDGLQARLPTARPDERFDVVVTFVQHGDAAAARQVVGDFEVRREFKIIPGFAGKMTSAQIRALARASGVFRIEEDFKVKANLDAVRHDFGTDAARTSYGLSGNGVGVCFVDTGVDPNHEQLLGKVQGFKDYVNLKTTAYDDHGHGTHVASIATGKGGALGTNADRFRGVAPGAGVWAAKVLDSSGSGTESDVIAGIQWCTESAQAGVRIISLSIGSGTPSDGQDGMSLAVNNAVDPPLYKVVVVAAGNSGDEPGTVESPGAAANAITVGACADWSAAPTRDNHSNGIYLDPFSSRGPTVDNRTKPDVCGPGDSVTAAKANTGNLYITYSGTSMATPFVAGTVALALEAKASLTPDDIRPLLESTAQGRDPAGKNNDWGAGLVDGYAFVSKVKGFSQATAFPSYTRILASVANNSVWSHSFYVGLDDLNKPIAAMITIDGSPNCVLGFGQFCFAWEWSPDLDAQLVDPTNTVITSSGCMGFGFCGAIGRQETLQVMPTKEGWYRIDVSGAQDSVNNGKGGSFALDLSVGPLAVSGGGTPQDFALSVAPTNQTVRRGASATYTETVTALSGFTGSVSFSVSGLPARSSASFTPVTGGSKLTVKTNKNTPQGSYTLTITGTSGSLTHQNKVNLTVLQ